MSHVTVPVALGARSYDIHVGAGLLAEADAHILPVLRQKRAIIVTDANVAKLHLAKLEAALDRAGVKRDTLVLPPGEHTKDFSFLQKLLHDLLDLGVERRTMLIALGGCRRARMPRTRAGSGVKSTDSSGLLDTARMAAAVTRLKASAGVSLLPRLRLPLPAGLAPVGAPFEAAPSGAGPGDR